MSSKLQFNIWRFKQGRFMKFIFRMNLVVSKVIFHWYYKRVPVHFHSWPFFKSVKILIGNYTHSDYCERQTNKLLGEVIRENTKLHSKIHAMEMKKLIDESQVDFFNNTFGLNLPKASDN